MNENFARWIRNVGEVEHSELTARFEPPGDIRVPTGHDTSEFSRMQFFGGGATFLKEEKAM